MVVQEYVDNPFLLGGLKFDVRVYVLLTSVDPVQLYVYEEGLVRFATQKYSNHPADLANNFIHLTNFSINKESDQFVYNQEPEGTAGHKWSLSTLWQELAVQGRDPGPVWGHMHRKSLFGVVRPSL